MTHYRARTHLTIPFTLALLLAFGLASPAFAQAGDDDLIGLGSVDRGSLLLKTSIPGRYVPAPLLSTDVAIDVTGIVGRATVKQHFANRANSCVEGIYAFPLPENAAVDHLRMVIGSRVIEGEIHERSEAKRIYERAKSEGRGASLLEEHRPNLFTVSVANIPAGQEVEVDIEYEQLVRYDSGRFSLRFPMVVAPRFEPAGQPATSATAPPVAARSPSTTTYGPPNPFRSPLSAEANPPIALGETINPVRLTVKIDAGVPLRRIESPTHRVESTMLATNRYSVRLVAPSTPADRDFQLDWWPELGKNPRLAVFTEGGLATSSAGPDRGPTYSLLMVLPPDSGESHSTLPREIVFVIDTSGSMLGSSLDQAKFALESALDRLRPWDRFNVIAFNSDANPLFEASRRADADTVALARSWVEKLESHGGTEMLAALRLALSDPNPLPGELRQVVFITDGLVGNESELFGYIRNHLGRTRLFTVGIGSSPNSNFMTGAARYGRGTFTYIGRRAEVAVKMRDLFRKIESPVLTGLRVTLDDPNAEIWPAHIPDLYAGEPLVVVARTSKPVSSIAIGGRLGERRTWSVSHAIGAPSTSHSGIAQLWARKKIEAALDELATGGNPSAVRERVLRAALDYHLVSPYTSLVAVDVTPAGVDPASCQSEQIPINRPAGMEMLGRLPQTATPSALLILCGLLIATLGVALRLVPIRARAVERKEGRR